MATDQEIISSIITLLEANLTDPATTRASLGKKWIWDDTPRLDISGYPRISVTPVTNSYEPFAVGDVNSKSELTVSIEIRTKKTDKFDVGTLGVQRAEGVVSYLNNEIVNLIQTNQSYFYSLGVLYIIPETNNRSVINDLVIDSLSFKVVRVV